jgi:hypothetical protein
MTAEQYSEQIKELKERLKNITANEIVLIFRKMNCANPFTDPKNRLVLKSKIREDSVRQINHWIDNGFLAFKKD